MFSKFLSIIFPTLEKKMLKDTFYPIEEKRNNNFGVIKKKILKFKNSDVDTFIRMESTLRIIEKFLGLRPQEFIVQPKKNQSLYENSS
jgi:hypothetical protein